LEKTEGTINNKLSRDIDTERRERKQNTMQNSN